MSAGNNSSIAFEATGEVTQIKLADASIGLQLTSAQNIGYQVVAEQGLTPLIGFCRIRPKFLGLGSEFSPATHSMVAPVAAEAAETEEAIKTEESDEELDFLQAD